LSGFIEKLDTYNIITNLLPGAFFFITFKVLFETLLWSDGLVEIAVLCYFIGLIIGRIGSLVIPYCFDKWRWVEHASREDYVRAVNLDSKIATLSEVRSYYRALLACSLVLFISWIVQTVHLVWNCNSLNWRGLATIPLVFLFALAFRKQNYTVSSRVRVVIKLDDKKIEKPSEGKQDDACITIQCCTNCYLNSRQSLKFYRKPRTRRKQ